MYGVQRELKQEQNRNERSKLLAQRNLHQLTQLQQETTHLTATNNELKVQLTQRAVNYRNIKRANNEMKTAIASVQKAATAVKDRNLLLQTEKTQLLQEVQQAQNEMKRTELEVVHLRTVRNAQRLSNTVTFVRGLMFVTCTGEK